MTNLKFQMVVCCTKGMWMGINGNSVASGRGVDMMSDTDGPDNIGHLLLAVGQLFHHRRLHLLNLLQLFDGDGHCRCRHGDIIDVHNVFFPVYGVVLVIGHLKKYFTGTGRHFVPGNRWTIIRLLAASSVSW